MASVGSVRTGGVSLQEALRWGRGGGCVSLSSLLGTLGLAAPSPASVQGVERDVGLGKEKRKKVRVGLISSALERDSSSHANWVGWDDFSLPG